MTEWNFTPDHPISLTLAADARLCPTTYTNDQIWELNFGNSEPPAISLQTTFGLRARICRIFPRFITDGQIITDPAQFHRPIIVQKYYPNYIKISCKPFSGLNVEIEYWVPSSQVIAGKTRIVNTSHEMRHVQMDWVEHLIPSPDGNRMALSKIGLSTVLAGQTADLYPVLFITGSIKPGAGPYPSLSILFDIPPHGEQESRWANASLEDVNASFEQTKQMMNRNWQAEFARIERINSQDLQIITGNHEWNTGLLLAQTIAHQLFLQPTEACKEPSFVCSRHPDQGFSIRKDGSDYSYLWNGQTLLDSLYVTNFLLPGAPGSLRSLLNNFLATQTSQGEIDWKPGLGGQRSQLLATPLLATLAWLYYEYSGDIVYLKEIFSQLTQFYYSWFLPAHDRDNDLVPEWDQATQTGYEENPLFSIDQDNSTGLDISTVESPDLIAYLFKEGQSLIHISKLLGETDAENQITQMTCHLSSAIEQSWSDQLACYLYRDRDSHLSPSGELLGEQTGSGVLEIHREFNEPIRPLIIIKSKRERTRPVEVYIHGTTSAGAQRVDHIPVYRTRWHLDTGFITSEHVYRSIEHIEIAGIGDDIDVIVRSADLHILDQCLLMPLWAGLPGEEKTKVLVHLSILDKKKYLGRFGLRPRFVPPVEEEFSDEDSVQNFPWISLVLEGLGYYGMHKQAAEVFSRLMSAVTIPLKKELKFYQAYHSDTGQPSGPTNTLTSLLPVGLFLKVLGVKIINPGKVEINHGNPFPWPVTIKFRGLTIMHHEKKSMVILPDGQTITVENHQPQLVSMESPAAP